MRTADLAFDLPPGLIAVRPAEPRDSARLLVVSRSDPDRLEHRHVSDMPGLLDPGDTLVMNASKVLPARFIARNLETSGKAEGLWLRDDGFVQAEPNGERRRVWVALLKARRHRPGRVLALLDHQGNETTARIEILGRADDEPGAWRVAAWDAIDAEAETPAILDRVGRPPLPPYIRGARREAGLADEHEHDHERYQTVYAESVESPTADGVAGSVAAPTAGLHFTPGLLARLQQRGVARTSVVLHVGTGTFKPVEAEELSDHPMHGEWCSIPPAAGEIIKGASRVIAVGTTSVRTLEAFAALEQSGGPVPAWIETDLLIQPGYRFLKVDGLLTNFHLPGSTLLALVAAIMPGGIDRVREIYAEAIRERYRFFSYGDAMLILP